MISYFFDSSALLKRYYAEQGTAWVHAITSIRAANSISIAQITPVEVISGIARRQRNQQLSPRRAQVIRLLLDRHVRSEYKIVPLTDPIVNRAQDLVSLYPLRAYDVIQLASALEDNIALIAAGFSPLIFVSSDTRLLVAAAAEGLPTDDPNNHP